MGVLTIDLNNVSHLLGGLIGREVQVQAASNVEVHPATVRGLVTDDNQLVSVIACDLAFAHFSGAALAMIPKGVAEAAGDQPDADLIEVYGEIANVLSRLVNEARADRVRLDPGMTHSEEALAAIMSSGHLMVGCELTFEGYGPGKLAIWNSE